jgi:hypothetical protein
MCPVPIRPSEFLRRRNIERLIKLIYDEQDPERRRQLVDELARQETETPTQDKRREER